MLSRLPTMQAVFLGLSSLATELTAASSLPGVSSYVAPAGFPTEAFSSYYINPAKPTAQPQPIIHDPVLNIDFPAGLTDPYHIPQENHDPVVYPKPVADLSPEKQKALIKEVQANVTNVIKNATGSNCMRCKAALQAAKPAALYAPTLVPDAMITLCKQFKYKDDKTCKEDYAAFAFGAIWTQVLAYADVSGLDGEYICNKLSNNFCPRPYTSPLNKTNLFPKPKPKNPRIPKPNGHRIKVAHLSDFHLDPRYAVNSEANCSSSMCCRANLFNSDATDHEIFLPASPYGYFKCDTPYDLGLATLQSVGPLTGTGPGANETQLAFTLYTGDLVSHDHSLAQMSRHYVEYVETSVAGMLNRYLTGPVYSALGNHDTNPQDNDAPHSLPGPAGHQQSWNYDHVAALWKHQGWLDAKAAADARTHYGGYSIKTPQGLRIISFNTDFWYSKNFLAMVNTSNPDVSGTFAWMIEQLQFSEDVGERVWLIGHVPSGWEGTNPMPNPTDLFYQIVERYSPHVIAGLFFGHTHEDEFTVYYAGNGTMQDAEHALATAWIGPSITPITNLNPGYRLYEVDTGDFNIYDAWTFYTDVSEFDGLRETGPVFELEYSTRETYGEVAGWPADAPLNATFWHRVTEAMERDGELVQLHNELQGRRSVKSPVCGSERCRRAKVCYMRSGSVALGRECPQGFGSVQSKFTG